jgi:hypothetical protein
MNEDIEVAPKDPLGKRNISVTTLISHRDQRPVIAIEWGVEKGQLDLEQARAHARMVLEACEAAEMDACVFAFLKEKIGLKDEQAAGMIQEFRQYREKFRSE